MDYSEEIFDNEKCLEWCSDFYGEYSENEQTNPTGPKVGKNHVVRSFTLGRNKWQRKFGVMETTNQKKCIRIVISADKV